MRHGIHGRCHGQFLQKGRLERKPVVLNVRLRNLYWKEKETGAIEAKSNQSDETKKKIVMNESMSKSPLEGTNCCFSFHSVFHSIPLKVL